MSRGTRRAEPDEQPGDLEVGRRARLLAGWWDQPAGVSGPLLEIDNDGTALVDFPDGPTWCPAHLLTGRPPNPFLVTRR